MIDSTNELIIKEWRSVGFEWTLTKERHNNGIHRLYRNGLFLAHGKKEELLNLGWY